MSSINYGGKLLMKAENINKNSINDYEDIYDSYPFEIPKVYLDGTCEDYFPQIPFSWGDDSVVLVRGKRIIEYTRSCFSEILAKDKDGNLIWVDGRSAPYDGCWDGEYLDEIRNGEEYTIIDYDIEKAQKKKYKMILDETTSFDTRDYYRLSNYVDAETLGSYFEIKDGILHSYVGKDKELIIPEQVTKLGCNTLIGTQEFESISIPKSLTHITDMFIERCKTKHIKVDPNNPKYYTNNGCLIDKETKTLVWAYAGNIIPSDGSVNKIGICAFSGREDLKAIVIPNAITEIESCAFINCINLTEIEIPNSVIKIGCSAFSRCKKLVKIILPSSLKILENYTFSECTSLASVQLPESLSVIEKSAFAYCNSLKEIDLPEVCIKEAKDWFGKRLIKGNNEWCIDKTKQVNFAGFDF